MCETQFIYLIHLTLHKIRLSIFAQHTLPLQVLVENGLVCQSIVPHQCFFMMFLLQLYLGKILVHTNPKCHQLMCYIESEKHETRYLIIYALEQLGITNTHVQYLRKHINIPPLSVVNSTQYITQVNSTYIIVLNYYWHNYYWQLTSTLCIILKTLHCVYCFLTTLFTTVKIY